MNHVKKFVTWVKRSIRFRRICKALKITPLKWQKRYVLHGHMSLPYGRQTGKTMAVVLKALVENPVDSRALYNLLGEDPDFGRVQARKMMSYKEYRKYHEKCKAAGIAVNNISQTQFREEVTKRDRYMGKGIR